MNWEGYGRKRSLPVLKYYPSRGIEENCDKCQLIYSTTRATTESRKPLVRSWPLRSYTQSANLVGIPTQIDIELVYRCVIPQYLLEQAEVKEKNETLNFVYFLGLCNLNCRMCHSYRKSQVLRHPLGRFLIHPRSIPVIIVGRKLANTSAWCRTPTATSEVSHAFITSTIIILV
jgi:hypothetical protein